MDRLKIYVLKIKDACSAFAKKFLTPRIAQPEEAPLAEAEKQAEAERNRKMDMYIEFVLIFILGILIGIAVKTEANKRITIGFDDYQMKLAKQDFNINQLQVAVANKSAAEAQSQGDQNGADPNSSIGAVCTENNNQ